MVKILIITEYFDIDLTLIQEAISNLEYRYRFSTWLDITESGGFLPYTAGLVRQLESCSEVTNLYFRDGLGQMIAPDIFSNPFLDLRGCNKLEGFYASGVQYNFKLPSSLTTLKLYQTHFMPDVSICKNLTTLDFGFQNITPSINQFLNFMESLSGCIHLEILNLRGTYIAPDLSACSYLNQLTNITSIILGGREWKFDSVLTSLDGIENLILKL